MQKKTSQVTWDGGSNTLLKYSLKFFKIRLLFQLMTSRLIDDPAMNVARFELNPRST